MSKLSIMAELGVVFWIVFYPNISTAQVVNLNLVNKSTTWETLTVCAISDSYQCGVTLPCDATSQNPNQYILDTGKGNPANDVCLVGAFKQPASTTSFTWVMGSSCYAYGWTPVQPASLFLIPNFSISVPSIPWNDAGTNIAVTVSTVTDLQGNTTMQVECSGTNLNN